jgi:histidyl-tRNA synthetase
MQDNASNPKAPKSKKPQKLRARLPRGLVDRDAADLAATRRMTDVIREVYERYGFEPVETPAMEFTDALGKFLPDQDRPNEGVFSFQDDDEQWISLRYDLTAPLARYVAENWDALPKPYRSYRAGYVYRNEKPGPGRFRQFMQFDADTVGSASPAADAEMCMMAADAMEALGIPRGSYVVKVNNRKVLDGVMESIGLGGDEHAGRRLTVLRAIDKLDKFPIAEVEKLLGGGRWDGGEEGKGDFTKGAGLDSVGISRIISFTGTVDEGSSSKSTVGSNEVTLTNFKTAVAENVLGEQGVQELTDIKSLVEASGYGDGRIVVDPSVVRGLEYYTGAVFEVELLLDATDEKGRPVRFGSVGGGGRYDGLVSRFRGETVPATGFSIGVSRLQAALDLINRDKPKAVAYGPVVVTVFGGDIADYQKMVAQLRKANIRAELYLGNPKHSLGQQVKYADKRNSPCVITQGSDEKAAGTVQINDLIAGAGIADIADRDEYLRRKAASLETVPEADLFARVQALLQRHDVTWR